MRIFSSILLAILLAGLPLAAQAANETELSGSPAVLPTGLIMLEGHDVKLWGIDPLANDQQCWHDNRAWDCGEEALIVLRHHLTGSKIHCTVKSDLGGGKLSAQCFRKRDGKENDAAQYLVVQGWARDRQDDSDGLYADDQEQARLNRRGIWTSHFQSAEDWKNGVPHYVEYKMAPSKPRAAAHPQPASGGAPDKSQ